jgi:hypothetical protein
MARRKTRTDKIDRELFHAWLWENRGRNNVIPLTGAEIARRLHFSRHTPVRLFGELVASGRLKKIPQGYEVIDPELF